MRAWRVDGVGAPVEVLALETVPPPEPPPGFVRVRVAAAGIGLPDVLMCEGSYPLTPDGSFTPGQQIVGTVTEVGEGVDPDLLGTRQMGVTAFYLGHGGFAEEALAAADTVHPAPALLTDDQAASFHIPFITAWIALVERAGLAPGERLLVLGAAGSSGSAAVQLGRALGATVVAVAGGSAKADHCRKLGADTVVDSQTGAGADARADALAGAFDGQSPDVLFDPVGGEAASAASRLLADGGRHLLVGFASGSWAELDAARLVRQNIAAIGVYAGAYDRSQVETMYRSLLGLVEDGSLETVAPTVHPFGDLPCALESVRNRTALGRQVLSLTT